MGEQGDSLGSSKSAKLIATGNRKNVSRLDPVPRCVSEKVLDCVPLRDHGVIGRGIAGDAALFLLKFAALEAVRRFSRAKCPSAWNGIQALQLISFPPLKWLQRWAPFQILGRTMQMISRPLLLLSVVKALPFHPDTDNTSNDSNDSPRFPDTETEPDSMSMESSGKTSTGNEAPEYPPPQSWLLNLYAELNDSGISLPERIDEKELHRFYAAANADFSCLLLSIKKTIYWRETYHILTARELERWSKVVFWHGCDVRSQPCLIVRLGLGCKTLPASERPRFAQAIVSQVEHGVLHLLDEENSQINVLVDCEGMSPLRLPMQVMRSCSTLLQDHFPNRLSCLFVIRLPPLVRVVAQTFSQALKPVTKQKLKFIGNKYQEYLTEHFQSVPAYLGSNCTCTVCSINIQHAHGVDITDVTQAIGQMSAGENISHVHPGPEINPNVYTNNGDQIVRTVLVGILMFWTFLAFIAGVYDPESRPFLST